MNIIFELIILVFLFYILGRLIYAKNKSKHNTFLTVLLNFFLIMIVNFFIMLGIVIAFVSFITNFTSEESITAINEKLPTVQLLIILLIIILLTAIIQFLIRQRWFKSKIFKLNLEEYEISEYFIQWMTIYVVVYQFLFNGFSTLIKLIPEFKNHQTEVLSVWLTPDNINTIIQPLLIATWIVVVMEKIKLRNEIESYSI